MVLNDSPVCVRTQIHMCVYYMNLVMCLVIRPNGFVHIYL